MKKIILFLWILNFAFGQDKILEDFFKDYNTSGTFIVFDGKNYASNDFQRAKQT
ncbi:class D beta-lactamase, partial [Campylobacter jejuni]|nr:class D beta-lactamase [Campylobacter jejuni]